MKDGFVRVGCCSPVIRVADCRANAEAIIAAAVKMHERGVRVALFPELCVTGSTCGDLFARSTLLDAAESALKEITAASRELDMLLLVGVPVAAGACLYNCAAAICGGRLLALVPQDNLSNHSESSESRWFSPAPQETVQVSCAGFEVPMGKNLVLECESLSGLTVGVLVGSDITAPSHPDSVLAQNGAAVIAALSASAEIIGRASSRTTLALAQSERLVCAYLLAGAGQGESTGDLVFSGHCLAAECGVSLAEQRWTPGGFVTADIDVDAIARERRRVGGFAGAAPAGNRVRFSLTPADTKLERYYTPTPFVPENEAERENRCAEILTMQSCALATRLSAIGCKKAVLGLSGGLDSTLALIVCVRTFDLLGIDRKNIITVTMPCFGTTGRTRSNACRLAESYGVTLREIPIAAAAELHLADIGHDGVTTDVTYENAQARERTQILMDIANMENGIVVGTGDLSEVALGWSTYNGDHMSMYGVNCDIPKTLIRYIVLHEADRSGGELGAVLTDVFKTPVSPELLPPKDGDIAQITENIVGPYEVHDFFLYHFIRWGAEPAKLYRLARHAFGEKYDGATVKKWLVVFLRRFFTQQFKRSCVPDGVKVGSVALSPRGDWRMPSDASASHWLQLAEGIDPQ